VEEDHREDRDRSNAVQRWNWFLLDLLFSQSISMPAKGK
jgi:hypothetical protein